MPLYQFAAEVQPQPRACNLRGACILCPHEPPKDPCLLVSGNTDAPITDCEERDVWLDLFMQGPQARTRAMGEGRSPS